MHIDIDIDEEEKEKEKEKEWKEKPLRMLLSVCRVPESERESGCEF